MGHDWPVVAPPIDTYETSYEGVAYRYALFADRLVITSSGKRWQDEQVIELRHCSPFPDRGVTLTQVSRTRLVVSIVVAVCVLTLATTVSGVGPWRHLFAADGEPVLGGYLTPLVMCAALTIVLYPSPRHALMKDVTWKYAQFKRSADGTTLCTLWSQPDEHDPAFEEFILQVVNVMRRDNPPHADHSTSIHFTE